MYCLVSSYCWINNSNLLYSSETNSWLFNEDTNFCESTNNNNFDFTYRIGFGSFLPDGRCLAQS